MRILILTQIVDLDDPSLSFFHRWIEVFATKFEHIEVICLKQGRHALPANVRVHSLGKETGRSRIKYVRRFYQYMWQYRHEYDAVYVHMNQEYILLGGLLWRLMGKRVTMWRNYHYGTIFTRIAMMLCHRIFCTSTSSFTAQSQKTIIMPVGIDTDYFSPNDSVVHKPHTILSLGRIAQDKCLHVLVDALGSMKAKGTVPFEAHFYGDELPKGLQYLDSLKEKVLKFNIHNQVSFSPGIPHTKTLSIYREHEIFVNLSPSGMYDKTIFEAAACGCMVVASSADWGAIADKRLFFDGTAAHLAEILTTLLTLPPEEKKKLIDHCMNLAKKQSLAELGNRLSAMLY